MPFKSQAQRGFLFANKPAVAAEFARKTPPGDLPAKVNKAQRGKRTPQPVKPVKKGRRMPS